MDCASAFGSFFENRLWLDSSCDKDLDDTQFCWSPSTRKYLRANMYEKCLVGTGFRGVQIPNSQYIGTRWYSITTSNAVLRVQVEYNSNELLKIVLKYYG
jgi:hypothetical protein